MSLTYISGIINSENYHFYNRKYKSDNSAKFKKTISRTAVPEKPLQKCPN
jgi:hypothetical protein